MLRYGMGDGGGLSRLPLTVGLRQGFGEREGINLLPVLRQGWRGAIDIVLRCPRREEY